MRCVCWATINDDAQRSDVLLAPCTGQRSLLALPAGVLELDLPTGKSLCCHEAVDVPTLQLDGSIPDAARAREGFAIQYARTRGAQHALIALFQLVETPGPNAVHCVC